jgi:DNA replication protein DnaC
MPEKIEETLKKLAEGTSKDGSTTEPGSERISSQLGDPECPHCHGVGYLRRDLAIDHPDFGKLEICSCRQSAVQEKIKSRLYQFSNLDELKRLTFESFNPRGRMGLGEQQQESIERAHNQSRIYSESPKGWLLIQGRYGSGKTHLAAAIANECVAKGLPTLFLTVPDLLDTLRFTYDSREVSFEERFEQIRRAPLLILDDFGTQSATEWAREKLFQILNFRYINQLPLVITTNLDMEEIEGRLRSRLSDPDVVAHVTIHAPDYRAALDDLGQHELSSLEFHKRQTFGLFDQRLGENLPASDIRTLDNAFKSAQAFAEDPEGWIVFTGPHGCGKTHLAAAIANYLASGGYLPMFIVVADLLDHLRATFNPSSFISYDRRFEEIRTTPILILDDLSTRTMTPWVREKLYQLISHRYDDQIPTVITTSEDAEKIDLRIRSWISDGRLCTINAISVPSYRGGQSRRQPKR